MKLKSKPINLQRDDSRGATARDGGAGGARRISRFIYEEFYTFRQCRDARKGSFYSSTVI